MPGEPDPVLKALGERLKALREGRDMRQGQLAAAAGLTRAYVVGIETGRRNPTYRVLVSLLEALDAGPDELFPKR